MKRIAIICAALAALILAVVPAATAKGVGPQIKFETRSHDFGTISEGGGLASCQFVFTNVGTEPLVIISATASCGCTKPSYPDEPIAPGQTGVIDVTFNPQYRLGEINKTVTVRTNDPKNRKVNLKLSGLVKE